ncbi:hypothetical protein BGX23_012636 [Mortierella sp. AD031]|nr:hypothetical protein BGX23_012636 [Mortierella sp. AD031]
MTTIDDEDIDSGACFQAFRSRALGLVRIPAVRHPVQGDLYIIWSDIRHCFPGVARIQFDNIYVPMLRDEKTLYRIRPHGIRYHADIVLDVVYEDLSTTIKQRKQQKQLQPAEQLDEQPASSAPAGPATAAAAPHPDASPSQPQPQQHSQEQKRPSTEQPLRQAESIQATAQEPTTPGKRLQLSSLLPSKALDVNPPQDQQDQQAHRETIAIRREVREMRKARGISARPAIPVVTSDLAQGAHSSSASSVIDSFNSSNDPAGRTEAHSQSSGTSTNTSSFASSTSTGLTGAFTMSVPLPSISVTTTTATTTSAATAATKRSRDEPITEDDQEEFEFDNDYDDGEYGDGEYDEDDYENKRFIQYMNGEDTDDDEDEDEDEEEAEFGGDDQKESRSRGTPSDGSEADAEGDVLGHDIDEYEEDVSGEDAEEFEDQVEEVPPSESEEEHWSDSYGRPSNQPKAVETVTIKASPAPTIDLAAATAMTFKSGKGTANSKTMTMSLTNSPAVANRLPSGTAISSVPVIDMTVTHPDIDTDLTTWDRRAAIAETMRVSPTEGQPFARPPRKGPLTVPDLVEHRVKKVLRTRQRWIEAACPRFFCILPTSEDVVTRKAVTPTTWDPSTDITATSTTMTLADPVKAAVDPSAADFHFFFICDCCDVPSHEEKWFPHGSLKEGVHNYDLTLGVVDDMIPKYGEYMMGILEMLKYGVYLDNRLKFPAQTDAVVQRRLSIAIKFLETRGILSCFKYFSQNALELRKDPTGASILSGLAPIEPLSKTMTKVLARRLEMTHVPLFEGMSPFRTRDGDVRWVCLPHWYGMSHQAAWAVLNKFQGNNKFVRSEYHTNLATFRATALNRAKAQEFYWIAGRMSTTCVFRLFNDFDMNAQDEAQLCAAVGTFPAACVHITVRPKTGVHDGAMHGFAKGYWTITLAALQNKKLEGFRLVQGTTDDPPNFRAHYERSDLERSTTDHVRLLTRMKRSAKDRRLNVTVVVTDIDRAVNTVRRHVKGLHHFSKLVLATDFLHNEVQARFARPGSGVPGCDVEDTDYEGDLLSFFVQRNGCDTIKYTCIGMPDNQFLMSRALTTVQMAFSLVRDRNKVRELIKHSKALTSLTLQNSTKDDPSQVYESLKALLANHPSLKELSVQHKHLHGRPSDFIWRNPNNLAEMRVQMNFCQGDKIRAMFQKYATSIEELTMDGMDAADAAVFEKSMRTKKGPLKLCRLVLRGLHLWEPQALEDIKKVVLRHHIMEVQVAGGIEDHEEFPHDTAGKDGGYVAPVVPRIRKGKGLSISARVSIWFEFIFAIRDRLTGLNIWGKATSQLIQMLGARLEDSIQMPLLNELTLAGEWKVSLLHYPWIERMLEYKSESKRQPRGAEANPGTPAPSNMLALVAFDVSRIPILDNEWERLLNHLDLYRLREFLVRQPNPMGPKTLASIVDQIPEGSLLETFSIDEDMGLSRDDVILQHRRIKERTSDKITIMINGYIVAP